MKSGLLATISTISPAIIIILTMCLIALSSQEYHDDLPCYDKHSNEIKGLRCEGIQLSKIGNIAIIMVPVTIVLFAIVLYKWGE